MLSVNHSIIYKQGILRPLIRRNFEVEHELMNAHHNRTIPLIIPEQSEHGTSFEVPYRKRFFVRDTLPP